MGFKKIILIFLILILFISIGILSYLNYYKNKYFDIFFDDQKSEISAGVVPHHLLAEPLIKDFFQYISKNEKPETIILLGPDHFNSGNIIGNGFITLDLDNQDFFQLNIDKQLIENLSKENNIIFNSSSVNLDHGITNLISFVQKYFPDTKIVPFIIPFDVSLEETEKFANSLNDLSSSKTIVIGSVDFSHYLTESAGEFHDLKSIRTLLNFEKENFKDLEVDSWQSLYIVRSFANLRKKENSKIIGHFQSKDFLENKEINQEEGITSYFSIVFQNKRSENEQNLSLPNNTVLFVGDIMLDRGVEYLMEKNSFNYPFEKIKRFLRGIDIVVGNLEGPINKNPQYFSDESLMFSFSEKNIENISQNFDLVNLANNHTLNMGEEGLEETRRILEENKIGFMGDPLLCSKDFSFQPSNKDIIFLAFNKTFNFDCSNQDVIDLIKLIKLENKDKFLIINIHWGNEYELTNSIIQQELGHQMIDAGADLIIGHHPHVVQNIELYNNKLIFYSLGNFIFDQYFSIETQQELAIGLEIYDEKLVYRIFPIQSQLGQPFLMNKENSNKFLNDLSKKSSKELADDIKSGIIEISKIKN
ncbi:MAG: AmmeMemoRadiSam system protein B [Candidatus Nealsonbacteria bacterium]